MEIEVIRSKKRKKTISARLIDDTLKVYIPSHLSQADEQKWVRKMKKKLVARKKIEDINSQDDLIDRAKALNEKYLGGKAAFGYIKYVKDQKTSFATCSPRRRTVRISERVSRMPEWVKNYVVLHELAHILEPNHGKSFWDLVNQYPRTERARGYLIACGMEKDLN